MAHNRHFGRKKVYLGEDTKGIEFKTFGLTTGKYFRWDYLNDTAVLVGTLTQTGNQGVTGDFTVTGNSLLKGTVGMGTGGTTFTVAADGALAIATDKFTVSAAGAVVAASTVKSTGDFTVGDSKFVVTATSGNTLLKGTLGAGTNGTTFTVAADGALAIATDKLTVSAAGALSAKGAAAFGANLTEFTVSTAGAVVAATLNLASTDSLSPVAYAANGAAWADEGTPAFIADQKYMLLVIAGTTYRIPLWANA